MIETLDDVVEQIADRCGIYGCHNATEEGTVAIMNGCKCRVCFVSGLTSRIRAAVEVEEKLYGRGLTVKGGE